MSKPVLLDLYCGQGGATRGYQMAGFRVVGVDKNPQPLYIGDEFHQVDAIEFLAKHWREFDAYHASPPCQAYTALKSLHDNEHPQLVVPTRWGLQATGKPYIIENVVGSPLVNPITLCGSMFNLGTECRDGEYRQLRRHRLFESSQAVMVPGACRHRGQAVGVYGNGGGVGAHQGVKGYKANKAEASMALGIDWMDRKGLSQSIPPAYTEHLGAFLMDAVLVAA